MIRKVTGYVKAPYVRNSSAPKKLIGQNVTVTCWDPQNAPGMWSKNDWFKDITLVNNITDTSHILDKGPCIKCGIYDHFVCFSEDFGQSWMHRSSSF